MKTLLKLAVGLLWAVGALAGEPAKPDLSKDGSKVELPGVTVFGGKDQRAEVPGAVALTSGLLEFVAVEPGGRDYESVLTLSCQPSVLQAGLLLIGAEAGPVAGKAKAGQKPGSNLRIEAEWTVAGKTTRVAAEKLLLNRKTKKPLEQARWVFTGSFFVKDPDGREIFLADAEKAMIALWWNPGMVVNLDGDFGNPYQGDDEGFDVNGVLIPPKGTPVKLIFRKAKEQEKE